MTRGILLIAFGHVSYMKWAYNMAYAIKYYNPDLPIRLIADSEISFPSDPVFERVVYRTMERGEDGKIDAAMVKIHMDEFSPFDQTIYLDVDGVPLKDISGLFDIIFPAHSVYAQVMGKGGKNDPISYSPWASNETIWNHYGLSDDTILCGLQSSIVAWDNSNVSKQYFSQLRKNYENKITDLSLAWGERKAQPDELYFSATMAQMGIVPDDVLQPVYFPREHTNKRGEIKDKHYILSMWGAKDMARPFAKDWYNNLMHRYMSEQKKQHLFKCHELYQYKFLGSK